jgi:hypothetical protein
MKKVHVFTSAAFNYIPKVRMLFQSLRKHHPEFVLHLALADKIHPEIDLSTEPFDDVMPLAELGIPSVTGWVFCHRIVELATAIKPFALQKLLARDDCEKVLYMDPDTVAFSRLDDILAVLDKDSLALTPHLTSPEQTLEGVMDNEISCLKHGIYNLGFIGVKADDEGRRFAKWWGDRIYQFCRDDIKNGLFTDQRWIDLVPALFNGVQIMKSSRHNVATWNLRSRVFSGSMAKGYTVDGEPLGFYHFTGFDSGAHRAMADKNAGGNESVRELIDWYTAATRDLGQDPLANVKWAFGNFSDGSKISNAQRIIFRDRVDVQAVYPDPFDVNGYGKWWAHQASHEYPGLFDAATADAELSRLTTVLTPGFSAEPIKIANLPAPFCSRVEVPFEIDEPVHPPPLWVRGWQLFRREGLQGVLRRFR